MDQRGNPSPQQSYVPPPSYQYPYPHSYMNYQLPAHAQAYAMPPQMQQLYSPQGDMMYHQQYYQYAATSSMPNYYFPQNMSMNYNQPNPSNIYGQHVYSKAIKFDSTNKSNDKTVEASIHYCEMCDKEMNSLSAYDAHCASHESCTVSGCDFKASKRVVQAHFHSVHGQYQGSGYKSIDVEGQKFCVLMGTDVKEVEQWREERRKKFPTTIKQMLRYEMKNQLLEAGGILPQSDKNLGKRGKMAQEKNPRKKNRVTESDDTVLQMCPTSEGQSIGNDSIGLEERNSHSSSKVCSYYLKGKCRRGSNCIYLHDSNLKKESSLVVTNGDKKPNTNKLIVPKPLVGGERGTLLKKLLEDEIMSEDNIILQCFRYFVKNDYFDNIV